ncbi:pyridoxal phosphate-dependent aminotransferase [Streptomyces sp. NPDC053431]|uniref:pyridoxal phosphate-dependent aminotransferase n=1 Tax=Streptomyces sp. NPDC053431 TaxID=3365703 RepID=UPI0037D37DCD
MDFTKVLSSPGLPTRFSEAELLHGYLNSEPAREPIYLSLGETWTEAAPGLTRVLASPLPTHSHGYVVTQYGLPRLQLVLRTYIKRTHDLRGEPGEDFEVAASCAGTRNAMFDFARMLNSPPDHQTAPVALVFSPGWDYASVFASAGYRVQHLPLSPQTSYPSMAHLREALDGLQPAQRAVLVINAQHNPTAINWRADDVRQMIRAALAAGAAILIDDAYFAVHNPDIEPTNALRILLEETAKHPAGTPPWLAVRSLGKQFHCNGWGIGAVTGPPAVIDQLMNTTQFQRSFISAVPLQEAMASWLQDPQSDAYLAAMRQQYADKRIHVARFFVDRLGYPEGTFQTGECTSYLRFQIPRPYWHHPDAAAFFRMECFRRTGVLFGLDPGHLDDMPHAAIQPTFHLRMFIGPPIPVLTDALERLAQAGITFAD